MELLPEGVSRKRMSSCSLKEAYVSKMVKVNDSDRWSLITLGNNRSKSVELKFVDSMRRQYEFSVDSFHILLDTVNTPLTLSTLELYTLVIFGLDCNQIGSILGWSVPRLVPFQIGQISDWIYDRLDL